MFFLPDEGVDYTKDYDEIAQPRNTYDECADYISNELVKAAAQLPDDRGLQEVARPTRGAALALRARVLLYAASPLYNGKAPSEVLTAMVDKEGRQLLSSTYDEVKWARAAAAAKDVMELGKYNLYVVYAKENGDSAEPATITPPDDNGTFHSNPWPKGWQNIDPFLSYRSLFDGTAIAYGNDELIYTRGSNQVHSVLSHQRDVLRHHSGLDQYIPPCLDTYCSYQDNLHRLSCNKHRTAFVLYHGNCILHLANEATDESP